MRCYKYTKDAFHYNVCKCRIFFLLFQERAAIQRIVHRNENKTRNQEPPIHTGATPDRRMYIGTIILDSRNLAFIGTGR